MMKKRIIFVTKALWIGGIESALINLLKYLDYDKYDVTLLVLRAELDMKEQIPPKCRLLIIDREQIYSFEKSYRYKKLYYLTTETDHPSNRHKAMMWSVPIIKWVENRLYIRYIRELMRNEKFDTAIIYSDVVAEATIRGIKADKYLMFYHHGAMRHVYHDMIAYRKCEKIIAVSENQAKELQKFVPFCASKIISIHNIIDHKGILEKAYMPMETVFDPDKKNIVTVGRVSYEKGMDIAVGVCADLVAKGHQDIHWWIIGDGPEMSEVKDEIERTHMSEFITLLGMKSNPYPYIANADIYAQPSRYEGYPMTLLEALVLGQPVISTVNNGAKEIIENNKTGILVSGKEKMLADAIEKILWEPDIWDVYKHNIQEINFDKLNLKSINKLREII